MTNNEQKTIRLLRDFIVIRISFIATNISKRRRNYHPLEKISVPDYWKVLIKHC